MISVIIPTYNRSEFLFNTLKSISEQSLSKDLFEIIIVDNNSSDDTQKIISHYKNQFVYYKSIFEPQPGLHVGRHKGMKEAKFENLVFADDDIEALPSWLESISNAFEDKNIAMVGGNNLPKFLAPPPRWISNLWNKSSILYGETMLPFFSILQINENNKVFNPHYVWGCNFSIRKKILLDAGGFHPDGMPKELIRFRGDGETHVSRYVKKKGLKCIFHPGATIYHKVTSERMTLKYFRKRGFSQGISDSYTTLRNNSESTDNKNNIFQKVVKKLAKKINLMMNFEKKAREALVQYSLGHKEGYEYHQNYYYKDQQLKDWVHKERYYK